MTAPFFQCGSLFPIFFNLQVQGNLTATARQLEKLDALDKDKQIIKKFKDKLEKIASALADRQK